MNKEILHSIQHLMIGTGLVCIALYFFIPDPVHYLVLTSLVLVCFICIVMYRIMHDIVKLITIVYELKNDHDKLVQKTGASFRKIAHKLPK